MTKFIIEEQFRTSYSIVFKTDKAKTQNYICLLNDMNKYFYEKSIFANAYVDFEDENDIIKIVGRIPLTELLEENIRVNLEFGNVFSDVTPKPKS